MKKAGKTGKTLSFQGANRKVGFSLVNYEEYADSIRDGGMNVFADVDDNHGASSLPLSGHPRSDPGANPEVCGACRRSHHESRTDEPHWRG